MRHIAFEAVTEIIPPKKGGWLGLDKSNDRP